MAKIAVLHTSFVFVNVELRVQQLLDEMLPDDEIIHFVDSDVLATVVREGGISADSENDPDVLAMIGSSAAMSLSGIPFTGPVGAVRVGLVGTDT